jgi:hypothetical protein
MERLKELKDQTKAKTKGFLHIDSAEDKHQQEHVSVLNEIEENPVFNPLDTLNDKPATISQDISKIPGKVHQISHNILHPISAAKEKTSSRLGVSETPYLTDDSKTHLLHAHQELKTAKAVEAVNGTQSTDQIDGWNAEIDAVEDFHEKRRVAWTSSRFIHRVRVVQSQHDAFPVLSSYRIRESLLQYHWTLWFRDILRFVRQSRSETQNHDEPEEPVWDQDIFTEHVERILMASDPWQRGLLHVHDIWCWEYPWKTATWFVVCLTVWYFQCVVIFFYCYVVHNIIQHGDREKRHASLKESYDRVADPKATALTFGEMIERHGDSNWLDPMLEAVGPTLQFRTNQMANSMEKLSNLYNWKEPRSTIMAIVLLGLFGVAPTLFGTAFATRLWTLLSILIFFTFHPLSIHYPNVYQAMRAMTWLDVVPTMAETSFKYLRLQANVLREKLHAQQATLDSNSSDHESVVPSTHKHGTLASTNVDIFANSCKWSGITGRLVVSTASIRFIRSLPRTVVWEHQYADLAELRKGAGQSTKPNKNHASLEFIIKDDSAKVVEKLKNRDELFNIIIAFSGLEWELLQPKRPPPPKGMVEVVKGKIEEKVGIDT